MFSQPYLRTESQTKLAPSMRHPAQNKVPLIGMARTKLAPSMRHPAQNQDPLIGMARTKLAPSMRHPAQNQVPLIGMARTKLAPSMRHPAQNQDPLIGMARTKLAPSMRHPAQNQVPLIGMARTKLTPALMNHIQHKKNGGGWRAACSAASGPCRAFGPSPVVAASLASPCPTASSASLLFAGPSVLSQFLFRLIVAQTAPSPPGRVRSLEIN